MSRPKVGVSSCLVGEKVRYDGTDKLAGDLLQFFDGQVEWVKVCPELEVGMGVPRETVQLEGISAVNVRMRGTESRRDHTESMLAFAERKVTELGALRLSGYIFKKGSPSCGPFAVKRFSAHGSQELARDAEGLFAAAVREAFPGLPIEDETTLETDEAKRAFMHLVMVYHQQHS